MKNAVLFSAMGVLAASGTIARAEEIGRVLESSPVIQQVQVPRQVCSNDQPRNMQQCTTQTFLENRTVAYNVRYEYAGREYRVQMPYDPGPTIRLQVTPVADNGPAPSQQGGVIVAPPVQGNGYNTPIPPAYPQQQSAYPQQQQVYPASGQQGQPVDPANTQAVPQSVYLNSTPSYLQSPDGYPPSGTVTSTTYYPSYPYYPYYGYPYYNYPYYGYGYGYPYFPVALSLGFGYWGWGGGGHGWHGGGGHGGGGHGGFGGGGGGGGGGHGGGGHGGGGGGGRH